MIPEAGEETLQAVLNGDAEAFRSILRSYGPRVGASFPRTSCRMRCPKWLRKPSSGAYRSLRSYQGARFL